MDLKTFYKAFRLLFDTSLNQTQVNGFDFLIRKLECDARLTLEQVAYILATAYHETAGTMQPIKEYRAKAGTRGRANQDRYWLTGYYGRGYVQLTWDNNYRKAGEKLGKNFIGNPDAVLAPENAYEIMVRGMLEGWFTGKKFSDYSSYRDMRRIINGTDRADLIAGYADRFEIALKAAR